MRDEAPNHVRFAPQACDSQAEFMSQFVLSMAGDIAQLDMLEIVPDTFVRVQVRRIARHLFQEQPLGATSSQEGLDALVAVDRSTIPDERSLPLRWHSRW